MLYNQAHTRCYVLGFHFRLITIQIQVVRVTLEVELGREHGLQM